MDQKKTAVIDNHDATAEQEEKLKLPEQKSAEKSADGIITDIDTRSEAGEEANIAQQIDSVDAGSSLDKSETTEIAEKLKVKDRLKKVAREIQKLHHQYRYKIYSALNKNRVDGRYEYKLATATYDVVEDEILDLAATDLKLAVARFEKDVEDKNLFPQSRHNQGYNRLNGSDLQKELSKRVWEVVEPVFKKSLIEGITAVSKFPAGKARQQSDYEITMGIIQNSKSGPPEGIKQALLLTPKIASEVWNYSSGERIGLKNEDLPSFLEASLKQGDLKTAYLFVDRFNRGHSQELRQDQKFLSSCLKTLYDTGNFEDIGVHFADYEPVFSGLPQLEKQTVVEQVYNNYPHLLYNFKNFISMNESQRKRIIQGMISKEQNAALADNRNAELLGIDHKTQQEALENFIDYDPMAVVKMSLDTRRLVLTAEQKQKVFKAMMERAAKADDNYDRSSQFPKESFSRTLLKKEIIGALDLNQQQITEVLDVFIERSGDRGHVPSEDLKVFTALGLDHQKLLIKRLAEKLDVDPVIQELMVAQVNLDSERLLKVLENLTQQVFTGNYTTNLFYNDEVVSIVRYHEELIPQLQNFYERAPQLMENTEIFTYILQNKEKWSQLDQSLDNILSIPAEYLSPASISLVLDNPEYGDKIPELIQAEPLLMESSYVVKAILRNYDNKGILINFFRDNQKLGKDLLEDALICFNRNPEYGAEILEVAQITPELVQNPRYDSSLVIVCQNLEALLPFLDQYNSTREIFSDGIKKAGYSPVLNEYVIDYINNHLENVDTFFESVKKLSDYENFWLIGYFPEKLATDPEAADKFIALRNKVPELLNRDNPDQLRRYMEQPQMYDQFLDLAEQKNFILHSDIIMYVKSYPETKDSVLELVQNLPDNFPPHALSFGYIGRIIHSPELFNAFKESSKAIPQYFFSLEHQSELSMIVENYVAIKPLLEHADVRPVLLFNDKTIRYASINPEQIPALVELIQNLPEAYITDVAAGKNLMDYIKFFLADPELLVEVSNLPETAPILLENNSSMRLYIENYKLFQVFTEFGNEDYSKFLFNSLGMNYLTEHPEQLSNYISLVKQTPLSLPEAIFSDNIEQLLLIPENQREAYMQIFIAIDNSPSQEIQRLKNSLLQQIVTTENPQLAYAKIESIFVKNNLPTIGKIYKVFEVLYPESSIQKLLNNRSSSPALIKATKRRRQDIIYQDLLRTHIASGNRSLRNYVKILSEGESILKRIEIGGAAALDEGEQKKFNYFLSKLETLLANSSLNEGIEVSGQAEENLTIRYERISRSLGVKPGQTISERVVEMFARPVGLESVEQLLQQMELAKQVAHERNINLVEQAQDGKLTIEAGDLLKGTQLGADTRDTAGTGRDMQYLNNILQNGSVAGEFLGASASSDQTPFDTDLSLVLEEDVKGNFTDIVNNSMAQSYGPLLLCVKDRGQFEKTSNSQSDKINTKAIELFPTGGGRHYGIRTGFPSTEIDFMIVKPELVLESRTMEKLYFEIAQNGTYISVVDQTGKILFTPKLYNEYRKTFQGIEAFEGESYEYKPSDPVSPHYEQIVQNREKVRDNQDKVTALSGQIAKSIQRTIADYGMNLKDSYDSSILGTELLDTGSTGRGTNLDKQYDFDLNLRLDAKDFPNSLNIAQSIRENLSADKIDIYSETDEYHQLRAFGVTKLFDTEFEQPIDIDLGFSKKSELVMYASHNAVADKLHSIKENNGESAYEEVVGNIKLAKQVLKAGEAYKKKEHGGMGGIGVETWILSHGGNITEAFQAFRDAAYDGDKIRTLEEFRNNYKILDAGFNLKFKNHDNYIRNLKPEGYTAMLRTIEEFLGNKE